MEQEDSGRPGGLSSQATEPQSVSALRASIPDALWFRDDDILELAENARRAICSQPVGFWVDPGAGSAMDRFQRHQPTDRECGDMARRGGHYETLYTGTSVEQMIIHVVRAAQAIEARRAETAKTGSVEDESAVPKGCAQPSPPSHPRPLK